MTLFDLFIIYLACGAPFGVYYFLHYRKRSYSKQVWLKSILASLFWIPFSYKLLKSGKIRRKLFNFRLTAPASAESEQEKRLFALRRQFEKLFLESRYPLSIYEMREIFERFAGLTLACRRPTAVDDDQAAELFRIAQRENVKLGAVCLNRRNQKRLEFHRTQARRDFLNLLRDMAEQSGRFEPIKETATAYAAALEDEKAIAELEKLSSLALQNDKNKRVRKPEKDLWTAEPQQPQHARPFPIRLPKLDARTNSLTKD